MLGCQASSQNVRHCGRFFGNLVTNWLWVEGDFECVEGLNFQMRWARGFLIHGFAAQRPSAFFEFSLICFAEAFGVARIFCAEHRCVEDHGWRGFLIHGFAAQRPTAFFGFPRICFAEAFGVTQIFCAEHRCVEDRNWRG